MNTQQWPIAYEVNIAWGDMDSFQHVNNVAYLRWYESARIAYMQAIGYGEMLQVGGTKGVGPILAKTVINYLVPVEFPDTITVYTTVSQIGNTSFVMPMEMVSKAKQKTIATGEAVLVLIDYRTGQKVPVNNEMRAKIQAFSAHFSHS